MSERAVPDGYRRGRVLRPHRAQPARAPDMETPEIPIPGTLEGPRAAVDSLGKTLVLLVVLPMFGQTFHYIFDVAPLYFLSKGWPGLTAPLVLIALSRARLPATPLFLFMLAYVLAVTPLLSMINLGNGVFDALATTAKALPMTYYFSFSALLLLLRPSRATVERLLFGLGIATFVIMLLLWLVVPAGWYANDMISSKLFVLDEERGFRIFMPMFFGNMFLFLCVRYAMAHARRRWLLGVAFACLLLDVWIFKQRTAIGCAFLVMGLGVVGGLPKGLRGLAWTTGLALAATLVFVIVSGALTEGFTNTFGGSLTVRQNSMALAVDYLIADPLRLIFGIGSITRFSTVTMFDLFGYKHFYLADLGWPGVLFEYGAIGSALIIATSVVSLRVTHKNAGTGDPLLLALHDMVLYCILITVVYSIMFTPGEPATATALSIYLYRLRQDQLRQDQLRRDQARRTVPQPT
ncbi:hypothetical protein L2U69_05520 [Zavarzinia compransoris]|uniref:hypothetical protein n=1 Tax=Zavarzinia marina TaxID=2911065 RepID=UPI001F4912BC|nr:hypothetical protein [Zavarzinia marina]MCF4165093.1 hypothetical protein [Zavarzinia marina]